MGIPKEDLLDMSVALYKQQDIDFWQYDRSQLQPKMAVTHQHILKC